MVVGVDVVVVVVLVLVVVIVLMLELVVSLSFFIRFGQLRAKMALNCSLVAWSASMNMLDVVVLES